MTAYLPTDLSTLATAFSDADGDQTWFKSINGQIVNWSAVSQVDVPMLGGILRIFRFGADNPPQFIGDDTGQNGPAPDQVLMASVAVVITDGVHDTAGTLNISVYGVPALPFGFQSQPTVTPSGTAAVGAVLTGSPGVMEGGTAPYTVSVQWKNGATAIPGATSTSYTTVSGDTNSTDLYMEVTATDSSVPAKTVVGRSNGVAVATTPLVNTMRPVILGTGAIGTNLSVTTGTWTGTAPITYAYQWTDNGADIPGATSTTLALTAGMEGHSFAVKVTATDAGAQSLTVTSGAILAALPGVHTVDTEEALILAEFASSPDKGWGGFTSEAGFTIINCATPDAVTTAWNNWKNGSPNTAKVKVLCQWNGILDGPARWSGPAPAKLVVDANEFGGYQFGPGGFWMQAAPGYSPIWGTKLQVTGATRLHIEGMKFAGTRAGQAASTAFSLLFDRTSSQPGRAIIFMKDCNVGQKDNRPGAVFATDYCGGIRVMDGAYSFRVHNVRIAGGRLGIKTTAKYSRGWKVDFQDTLGDIRNCFGFALGSMTGQFAWNHWELVLVRDMRQEASEVGLHTDNMQHGTSADKHAGYRSFHKYFLTHMKSGVALDSGAQGFYNDDSVTGQQFRISLKEGVAAFGGWHGFTKYDPSRAGIARLSRLMFLRAGAPNLDKSGLPANTVQQIFVSHGGANGGSIEADHVTLGRIAGPAAAELVGTNIRYVNAAKNTAAGQSGLSEANAKRFEEAITGTGGTISRDGADAMTYTIPGESNPDFAAAWWALRDFFTPVAGWGTAGVPTDPGTWPGVPPRP